MQQKDAGLIEGVLNAAKFCQTNSIDRNTGIYIKLQNSTMFLWR